MFMLAWSFERREARRALYARAIHLQQTKTIKEIAIALGLSVGQVNRLLHDPPAAEENVEAVVLSNAALSDRMAVRRAKRRKAVHQRERDEKHEAKAAATVCLIEALIEMRPYVGSEP